MAETVRARKEAATIRERRDKTSTAFSFPNRFKDSMKKMGELAGRIRDDKIVLHVVGVGGEGSPQLREAIGAIKAHTNKKLEVHAIDYKTELLDPAVEKAKLEFKDTEIIPHVFDVADPEQWETSEMKKDANMVICTRVLHNLNPPLADVGIHQLASYLKEGGHMLLDRDAFRKVIYTNGKPFGLKIKERILEEDPDDFLKNRGMPREQGIICKKIRNEVAFEDLWAEIGKPSNSIEKRKELGIIPFQFFTPAENRERLAEKWNKHLDTFYYRLTGKEGDTTPILEDPKLLAQALFDFSGYWSGILYPVECKHMKDGIPSEELKRELYEVWEQNKEVAPRPEFFQLLEAEEE